jgi:ribonucleoside-diphosphate reductase alpha chain
MKLDGIRQQIFEDRYALHDNEGKILEKSPEEMWKRVAKGLSKIEKSPKLQKEWEKKFYSLMEDFKFLPGGRILLGAGSPYENVTFYNCFVLPDPEDSRRGIIDNLLKMTEIMARGGGVGFNISSLRPRGAHVVKVNGTSSGPVNWAEIFSVMTHDIIQQGGTRRGALMLMMWDWHPDVFEFISVKKNHTKMLGANLSVCLSNGFMESVKKDANWDLVFPDVKHPKYKTDWHGDLNEWKKKKLPVKIYKTIKARELWDEICKCAWESAEPGLYFMERANAMSNTWYFETLVSTNPCGEQPLPPFGVCNLGALNLTQFVKNKKFDFEKLREFVPIAVRLLDNVIDAENYILPEMKARQMDERRVGLGTLGLGDALIMMEIRYGSKESLELIEKIYKEIRDVAYQTSSEIAKVKGSFGRFEAKKYLKGKFIEVLPPKIKKMIEKNGMRNSVVLTQAPTGKTSLLAGVTSGIEPVFSFSFKQKDRLGERTVYHPLYEEWLKKNPKEKTPDFFVTAQDLTPENHVDVEATIQKYTDSSISKTVNAPENHTVEEVKKLYMMAYETGLKGITYFREGSREGMLTSKEQEEKAKKVKLDGKLVPEVKIRPTKVEGATYRLETPVGTTYITVNHNGGREPMELFLNIGKAGSDISAMAEAMGRLISLIIRMASPLSTWERARNIVQELRGIGGSKVVGFGENKVRSLPDAIAKALAMHFGFNGDHHETDEKTVEQSNNRTIEQLGKNEKNDKTIGNEEENKSKNLFDICPSCGTASFAFEEGCKKCYSCGYSEC